MVLNDISSRHSVEMFWVPRHSGVRGNETTDQLAREEGVHQFVGPEPALGVSRQNKTKNIKRWMDNQHMAKWPGLISTQRQARKLISDPSPTAKTRLLLPGHSPVLLPTPLLDITPWEYTTSLHNGTDRHTLMYEACSRGGKLSSWFAWIWSPGFTQTHLFGLLFLGPKES